MLPRETIDRVLSAAKIEEVVGDYVHLSRRGANLIGLCPFHKEKTGSFTVSPAKGIYKCFGCGASGNVFGFVMEVEQCSFVEAVKQVGKKYHIEIAERTLTPEEQQRQDDRESMFVVNEFCNRWFQDQMWQTQEGQAIGLSYFRERGLRDDIIHKFSLGYSPEKGNQLADVLKKQGFIERFIVNDVSTKVGTGVCGKSEDGRVYDRFRARVIFPIHTISGKTVAFAGRIMKQKEHVGKYVNSPDSIIYSKTHQLYGLFLAKHAIARQDLCYLVEGQMDVISMHQAGIENVVASGGTALTKPQIALIKRFTSNITVLYDGDAAGIHAALRGIDMFLEENFHVQVVLLPEGEDPDSFAQKNNASDFIQYINTHQTDFIRFKVALLREEAGGSPQKRADLIKDVTQSIAQIPDGITRQVYIKDSADKLMINEQLLMREVARLRREKAVENERVRQEKERMETFAEELNTRDAVSPAQTTASHPRLSRLEENYQNLLRVVVRYGERPLYTLADGTTVVVGEYIISQLTADAIVPPLPIYQRVLEEFLAHYHEPNFIAERFFAFHIDMEISQFAVNLIADKYPLSRMYSKQTISDNVVQEVDIEQEETHLDELITRLIYEIKLTVAEQRIDEIERTMQPLLQANNLDAAKPYMETHRALIEFRNTLCRELGNRVIL